MATLPFRPYKVSALYRTHLALGARWVESGEWRLPDAFTAPEAEAQQVRQGVGVQDVSPIGKLDLKGRDIEALLATSAPETWLSVFRLRPDHALLLTPPGRQGEMAEGLLRGLSQAWRCTHLTNVTSTLSALSLVGPKASLVLAKLTPLDLRPQAFADGACAQTAVANVHAIMIRQDWGRLPTYCLLLDRAYAEYAWEAIRGAGESLGLVPFGLAAERLLRGGT